MAQNILNFSLVCQENPSLKPIWKALSITALNLRILRASMALDTVLGLENNHEQHDPIHTLMNEAGRIMNALATACLLHQVVVPRGYTTEDVCDTYTWGT